MATPIDLVDPIDQLARDNGFASAAELHSLVYAVKLDAPGALPLSLLQFWDVAVAAYRRAMPGDAASILAAHRAAEMWETAAVGCVAPAVVAYGGRL